MLRWYDRNGRQFPWRETTDPYAIFIAEMLLRQTQARRVVQPYESLINEFPDPTKLARANPDGLRARFRRLGLPRKADLLIAAAHAITFRHSGRIPSDMPSLLSLPGVGVYSASAIRCLAFGLPEPMIDESSGRLLRRVFGQVAHGRAYNDQQLRRGAYQLLPARAFARFNLGLLDLAAAHCTPTSPRCAGCPLRAICGHALAGRAISVPSCAGGGV